ncbi:hypothetical protein KW508_03545 [Vibrio fluvialis]|nr:hypothetical protein [Vibrio fluvialis]
MVNDWIYIGADREKQNWSKVGMTTRGLETRHTSSQNPDYFIFSAFNIVNGDVHKIESELLNLLERKNPQTRQNHLSTGSKSECFYINPYEMTRQVEIFLETNHTSAVPYEVLHDELSRYQCDDELYKLFVPKNEYSACQNLGGSSTASVISLFGDDLELWGDKPQSSPPNNLGLSRSKYFSGNQVEYETSLGDGYFIDHYTGLTGYRYENDDEDDDEDHVEWQ